MTVVIGLVASAAEAGIILGVLTARLEAVPFPISARAAEVAKKVVKRVEGGK
jgi:hypothetical protein